MNPKKQQTSEDDIPNKVERALYEVDLQIDGKHKRPYIHDSSSWEHGLSSSSHEKSCHGVISKSYGKGVITPQHRNHWKVNLIEEVCEGIRMLESIQTNYLKRKIGTGERRKYEGN